MSRIPLSEDTFLRIEGFFKEAELYEGHDKGLQFFSIGFLDIKYCFAYADFRDDWGFYIEYTDSNDAKDDRVKYPVSFGLYYVDEIISLMKLLVQKELNYRE